MVEVHCSLLLSFQIKWKIVSTRYFSNQTICDEHIQLNFSIFTDLYVTILRLTSRYYLNWQRSKIIWRIEGAQITYFALIGHVIIRNHPALFVGKKVQCLRRSCLGFMGYFCSCWRSLICSKFNILNTRDEISLEVQSCGIQ